MAKTKKLGTIGGVFMPSVLGILGVIMYLRLPWIVGQAGLLSVLGIIFVAHIISISTGLSISSIATDKRVKAGGMYYIISRSLGLPIGGTLGLALFIGMSFSISLYIIGFSEAFLSFFNFDTSLDSIRITGFFALTALTIITFISTKLAIKAQYFIFLAVILSLLSIFFGNYDFIPSTPNFYGSADALPWIVLFGIFFPAVTGFGAGVSMSGDLDNPNKSIPRGTIAAITFGMVVYVVLAFFFAYFVSPQELTGNPNILFDLSRIKLMVAVGIWSATISSALGAILSAPRILQALSKDSITPRFFAKGYGGLNEPRNALLLSFIIAFLGIMIGELNAIARIVSIFFIITYGFINLSCFVENWASTDFRPTFRIHPIISIVGALASMIVMIQLDLPAMIGATILLTAVFLYLKRKELTLQTGDTWDSVWESLVKSGLSRLNNKKSSTQNWRPNIILFSGGKRVRPHLSELATDIIGKMGIMTEFKIVSEKEGEDITDKEKNIKEKLDFIPNAFERVHFESNIYKGIEDITSLYGFSGIEPNTILMGLPGKEESLTGFYGALQSFKDKNFNSAFLSYNSEKGFGSKKSIDFWWDGESNNLLFGVSLLRFITSGMAWRYANCKLHFVNNNNIPDESVSQNLKSVIFAYRLNISVCVHNNVIENKSTLELIKAASKNTDLIITDFPDCDEKSLSVVINDFRGHTSDMPCIMLLKANTDFEYFPLFARKSATEDKVLENISRTLESNYKEINIDKTQHSLLDTVNNDCRKGLDKSLNDFHEGFFLIMQQRSLHINTEIDNLLNEAFGKISELSGAKDLLQQKKGFYHVWEDLLMRIKQLSNNIIDYQLLNDKALTQQAIKNLIDDFEIIINKLPKRIKIEIDSSFYESDKNDRFRARLRKSRGRIILKLIYGGKRTKKVKYRKAFSSIIKPLMFKHINLLMLKHQKNTFEYITELRKLTEQIKNTFHRIELSINEKRITEESLDISLAELSESISANTKIINTVMAVYRRSIFSGMQYLLSGFTGRSYKAGFARYIRRNKIRKNKSLRYKSQLLDYPGLWHHNTRYFAQQIHIELIIQKFSVSLKSRFHDNGYEIFNKTNSPADHNFKLINSKIEDYISSIEKDGDFEYDLDSITFQDADLSELNDLIISRLRSISDELSESVIISEPSYSDWEKNTVVEEIPTLTLPLKKSLDYFFESSLSEKLDKIVKKLNEEFNQKFRKLNNLSGLARYNIDNVYINEDLHPDDEIANKINYLRELKQTFITERLSFESISTNFSIIFSNTLKESFDTLTLSTLHQLSIVKKSGRVHSKRRSGLFKPFILFKKQIQKAIELLLYGRSKGIILAKSIQDEARSQKSPTDMILSFIDRHSPKAEVLEQLPFYYKNLFNNKFTVNQRFWIGRKRELLKADIALERYRVNRKGALMILGARNAGKSSLSNNIARNYFSKDLIYNLYPLREGSCSPVEFTERLSQLTGKQGNIEDIMQQLPNDSVIVINDMALWWERSENGMEVIKMIMNLIQNYSNKCLFIINSNTISFKFINSLYDIRDYFVSIINCESFSTYELRNLILSRHQSSEMTFKLGKLPESLMIEWRYAKLFNSYFNYSEGVIGTALNAWLSSIKSVKGKEILISMPPRVDYEIFEVLNKDLMVIMTQLILHRRLSKNRLLNIIKTEEKELDRNLYFLTSSRLIEKMPKSIFMVNSFIEPHLIKYLTNKEIV